MYQTGFTQFEEERAGEAIISLKDVALTYHGGVTPVDAISDINLDVREREFICLLGPSGCGKSTLLKLLAGFTTPSRGEVLMRGEPISGPGWERGVVFQQAALYPWLNVWDNAAFGLRMRKMDKKIINEKVSHYLDRVGLTEFRNHRIYELSGGMKQRLSIARVLANDSAILLMDEPFGALDALTRSQMQTMLRGLWSETRKTILFITHDVDEALSLATKILVMSKRPGRIIKTIEPEFSQSFSADRANSIRSGKVYTEMREQILDLISLERLEYFI